METNAFSQGRILSVSWEVSFAMRIENPLSKQDLTLKNRYPLLEIRLQH